MDPNPMADKVKGSGTYDYRGQRRMHDRVQVARRRWCSWNRVCGLGGVRLARALGTQPDCVLVSVTGTAQVCHEPPLLKSPQLGAPQQARPIQPDGQPGEAALGVGF
jgi:hypothetical protein